MNADKRASVTRLSAYCVLRTENIFVCWCCVGSDRAAGVGVSLGTLDLVRLLTAPSGKRDERAYP